MQPGLREHLFDLVDIIMKAGTDYNDLIDVLLEIVVLTVVGVVPAPERERAALQVVERLMNKIERAGLGPA
jgi:hypothetical protein